ncbi:MAG: DUF1499 domain-containing protein [Roseovarius sp.]|uniref:DUF1499 domain-containing protein n=1 Tax=Roseobacteraceae TaxID=2854170 RepID=UPI0032F07D0D
MRIAVIVVLVVLVLALGLAAYVRLAPSDPKRWHKMPDDVADRDFSSGAMRVIAAGEGDLARLHGIIAGSPRTTVLAGSVEEGMITYVSRTKLMGFPDYTTVQQAGGEIRIHARQRFGSSDLGVNAKRVDGWLDRFRKGG